jgi:hypothetical protein
MIKNSPETGNSKSLLSRLGLSKEPSKAAPFLRATLAFLAEMPGVGPFLKGSSAALKEFADEEDDEQLERRLFSVGLQNRKDIAALTDIARLIFLQQDALLSLFQKSEFPIEKEQLTSFAMKLRAASCAVSRACASRQNSSSC